MDIGKTVAAMTLEEKASLLSGSDFWHTQPIERLDIQPCKVSDGPHGLRTQADKSDPVGLGKAIQAVCFPAGCASAASFDRKLLRQIGEAIGVACQHEGISVILGPAVNIKRSPLCGRNFEYYSEDPYLAGEIATGFIQGVQSKSIGTSIKHFAANNQEHCRMSSNSTIDERTLREIYLSSFERAIKQSKPWTLMCSYNRINSVFSSDNKWLLTTGMCQADFMISGSAVPIVTLFCTSSWRWKAQRKFQRYSVFILRSKMLFAHIKPISFSRYWTRLLDLLVLSIHHLAKNRHFHIR